MSGYAEELTLNTSTWEAVGFEKYEFSYEDEQTAKLLEFGLLEGEALEVGLHRLAQIAALTESVKARSALAHFGGIGLHEARLFSDAVNTGFDQLAWGDAESEVLRRARKLRDEGSYSGYLALSASIGFYPPEYGDSIPVLDSAAANPFYDMNKEFMNDKAFLDLVGALDNHG